MRTVKLYGFLGKQFGRTHRLAVATPAEAVRALSANFPGFQQALCSHTAGYRVHVGDDVIEPDLLHFQGRDTIKFVPVVGGAKNGIGQVIVGALILAAAFYTGGLSLTATGIAAAGVTGQLALSFGASLVIGGVTQMLSPPLKSAGPSNAPANNPNYAFNGPVNTVTQGNVVPLCYGRLTVGSQVISARLTVEQTTGRQTIPASGNVT